MADVNHGYFLRKEKAIAFLKNEPPKKVMEYLGYNSMDEMLAKEDLFEIYSALRFVEGSEWLNGIFSSNMKVLCRLISKNGRLRFGHFPKNGEGRLGLRSEEEA